MASLYITEYSAIGVQQGTGVPVAFVGSGPIATQKLAIGAGSVPGTAFATNTRIVRLETDAICSIKFGPVATVTATANDARMAANQTEYYAVQPNASITVAVITNT